MPTIPIPKLILVGLTAAALGTPETASACKFLDWLCCRSPVAPVAQTTYAPPYQAVASIPSAGVAAPATTCASPVAACPTQTCYYVQETQYRAPARPLLTALFGPQVEQQYDPTTGCTVTTYRPRTGSLLGLGAVPTTTYRMVCSPTAAPAMSYSAVPTYTPGSAGAGVPGCATGDCGAPALPPAQTYIAPGPAPSTVPGPAPSTVPGTTRPEATTPRTFAPPEEQGDRSPEAESGQEENLSPVPDGNTRLNSMPAPLLIGPDNRTTQRSVRDVQQPAAVRVRQAAYRHESTAAPTARRVEVQWKPASR